MIRGAIAAALALAGCGGEAAAEPAAPASIAAPPPEPPAPSPELVLRERARLVLESRCGQCHIGAYDSAIPGALAVFDLAELEWDARLTAEQLDDLNVRMERDLGPDGEALGVTPEDRATIAEYVAAAHARRGDPAPAE